MPGRVKHLEDNSMHANARKQPNLGSSVPSKGSEELKLEYQTSTKAASPEPYDNDSPITSDSESTATSDDELHAAEICLAKHVRVIKTVRTDNVLNGTKTQRPPKDSLEDLLDYFAETNAGEQAIEVSDIKYTEQQGLARISSSFGCAAAAASSIQNQKDQVSARSCNMRNDKEEWYSPGLHVNYKDPHLRIHKIMFRDFLENPFANACIAPEPSVSPFDTSLTPPHAIQASRDCASHWKHELKFHCN